MTTTRGDIDDVRDRMTTVVDALSDATAELARRRRAKQLADREYRETLNHYSSLIDQRDDLICEAPDQMGSTMIAEICGVSIARISQIRHQGD